ncbi:hypothetical protein H4I95_08010 [Botrytis cinerea]
MPISSLAPPPPDIPGPSSASSHSRSHSQPLYLLSSTIAPSPESSRQIAEARTALNASIQNIFTPHEHALKLRAQNLHQNSSALTKQETDLKKEIGKLGKEGDKLEKVVREGQRKVKELGNVQNWAEVLERDFLVVEEVLKLVDGESEEWSGSESDWSEYEYEYEYEGNEGGGRKGSVGSNGSDGRTGGILIRICPMRMHMATLLLMEQTVPVPLALDKARGKQEKEKAEM